MQAGWVRFAWRTAVMATSWVAGALHAQGAAESYGSPSLSTRMEACKLIKGPPDNKGKPQVAIGCGQFGVVLGSGEGVEGQTDPKSGAIAVKLERFGVNRVYLATPRIGARPLLEDITGDLAIAMGRRDDRGIGDASVDLSGFAAKREIRVTAKEVGSNATHKNTLIAMDEHVARASKVAAKPPSVAETEPAPAGN